MRLISLKRDYAFKELFSRENVRKQFISDVLGIPLEKIRSAVLVNTNLWVRYKKSKQGVLDVLIVLEDGTKVNVEMQVRRLQCWTKRQLFYLAKMFTESLKSGEDYDKLCRCISIALLDFNLTEDEQYHKVYHLQDGSGKRFSDMMEVHVIELKKGLQGTDVVADWIRLFNAGKEEDLQMIKSISMGIMEAIETLKEMSIPKSMRYRYEMELKLRRDRKAEDDYIRDCGRAEGKAEDILQLLGELPNAEGCSIDEIKTKILNEKDLDVLNGWFRAAARAENIQQFEEKSGIMKK